MLLRNKSCAVIEIAGLPSAAAFGAILRARVFGVIRQRYSCKANGSAHRERITGNYGEREAGLRISGRRTQRFFKLCR